ncbi:Clp protease [Mycetocola tolaasinivorans]|uniref:Clp protease n=1 Tax=Mycetocola tolaasinivorans TaxID=76635 RepID=A0A3L6ZZA2_9MICO|nr:Clp protease N-terminal domain-containing protein [Mycetocola tolaasinivorans]RLP72771.1 Clp protease [Mycetocola tolaasinivorans]
MSGIIGAAGAAQTLSLAAMEEASRQGKRDTDIEHLLLALALSDRPAGSALRACGVSLSAVRRAIRDQEAAELAALGMSVRMPEPGRIVFHETSGYAWTRRAEALLSSAASARSDSEGAGYTERVLTLLLVEPSGRVSDVLARCGTSTAEVRLALAGDTGKIPAASSARARMELDVAGAAGTRGWVSGTSEVFVPAVPADVWALLVDPLRIPEWFPAIGTVSGLAEDKGLEDNESSRRWWALAPTTRPDGKSIRVREQFRRRTVQMIEARAGESVRWRFEFPDAARAGTQDIVCDLREDAGGTRVRLTALWARPQGWCRLVGVLLSGPRRLVIWLNLFQIGGALSRAFR